MLLQNLPAAGDFHYQWNHNLSFGDHNDEVRYLQIALMISGFLAPIAPEELGFFGMKTSRVLGAYQQAHGIYPAPDRCGPQTRRAFNAQFVI